MFFFGEYQIIRDRKEILVRDFLETYPKLYDHVKCNCNFVKNALNASRMIFLQLLIFSFI